MPPQARISALLLALGAFTPEPGVAQQERAGVTVTGQIFAAESGNPIAFATVAVEGTRLLAVADSSGRYTLRGVPPGPRVLLVHRLGYADARVHITVPAARPVVVQDIEMAASALELEGITVTADPAGRARGEMATASVIETEAIAHQSATSLRSVLELVPGIRTAPPGLDEVEQVALRSVPTAEAPGALPGGPSAAELASFGTLIVLDGVPLSNNANLQTLGPRGELSVPSSARGGVDLRRIPASTIQRVEVIRGIPSARWGDLTQGAIIVDTRAGRVEPTASVRFDPRLSEGGLLAGEGLGIHQVLSGTLDVTESDLAGVVVGADVTRVATQLSHRATMGEDAEGTREPKLTLDTRLDFVQLYANNPEDTVANPGRSSANRDRSFRASERARLALGEDASLSLTAALDYTRRRSFVEAPRVRGGAPFTDRLTEGRSEGTFVLGEYQSRVDLEGDEWLLYARLEAEQLARFLGMDHRLRPGLEVRREWNTGAGYQFEIARPPQVTFDGVRGYDRPRRFDDVPPIATSAFYLDDQLTATLGEGIGVDAQVGLRLDLLHRGTDWLSGVRDAALQPRLNLQVSPAPWLRLRGGWGTTAKQPSLAQLFPSPQYFDLVNVNFFANDPAERLAVLTTFIRDPTNPELGFSTTRKAEAGAEVGVGRQASISLVAFLERTRRAVGIQEQPDFLLRERYQLTDSVEGNGVPPEIIEPPFEVDTVPILIDRPGNNLTLESRGLELTAHLPELRPLRTRLDVLAAWVRTEFAKEGFDFGARFNEFQLDDRIPRTPFWDDPVRKGEQFLLSYRLIHHQPSLGLVITATIEHIAVESSESVAATDTLAFAGYMTRDGRLVRVPPEDRLNPEYEDLRRPRESVLFPVSEVPADWLVSVQLSKTLPRGGRLSFFAFNALDRRGTFSRFPTAARFFPPVRFGVEATVPLGKLLAPQ